MSVIARTGKALVFGTLTAAFGVGAIAGVVAERALIGRSVRRDPEHSEPFGSLHSERIEVVASDNILLHAEVESAIDAPDDLTIIFVHGFAMNMDEFHYQRRDLRHLARMVFFDQRGHGRSEKGTRESHKVEQLAVDLEQVIDTVAPTGPIILVGHSMGGMTVQQLAAKRPDLFGTRIKAVVLACTSAGGVTEVPLGLPTVVGRFIQGIAPHVTGALSGQQAFVDRSLESGNDLTLLLTRRYSFGTGSTPDLTAFVAKMHSVTPIEVIGDFLAAFGGYNSVETLPILGQVDTVVVAATDDLLTPLSHSEKIASLIPNAELIEIADTGHMLPMERYIEFNEIISAVAQRVRMNQA